MDPAAAKELDEHLRQLEAVLPRRRRVLIVPHDYPDPDALASAAAFQLLLHRRWGVHARLSFSGAVSRAENRALLRHLKFRWTMGHEHGAFRRRCPALFVDTAPWVGNVTVPRCVTPLAVVDHHPHRKKTMPAGLWTDIDPAAGATTTRLYEYLTVSAVTIPPWLASLMAYAIGTETFDLTRHAGERDIGAFSALMSRCNVKILGEIRQASLPREYYRLLVQAVNNAFTYGRVAWSHLDHPDQPEIVPEIADLLLRLERVTWSFCTALTDDRLLISLRSRQPNARCGSLLRRQIRKEGSAGGHEHTAAGYVDLAGLSLEDCAKKRAWLEDRLLTAIEGRPCENPLPLQ